MTQVSKQRTPPATPRQAARRRAPLDRCLDPELFRALSDPTRLRLFACLAKCARPCTVTEVAACCEVDFSVVARHLALLARIGVLEAVKEGRTVWYTVRFESLASSLRSIADALEQCCAGRDEGECCALGACGCSPKS